MFSLKNIDKYGVLWYSKVRIVLFCTYNIYNGRIFVQDAQIWVRLFSHSKFIERRMFMYNSPKAELLYPESEVVLSDVLGISQEQNDNDFNITDLL